MRKQTINKTIQLIENRYKELEQQREKTKKLFFDCLNSNTASTKKLNRYHKKLNELTIELYELLVMIEEIKRL